MNPQSPYAVWPCEDGVSVGADFATWVEGIAEFNVFIYTPAEDGQGLIYHQYAERAYDDEMDSFLQGLETRRAELVEATAMFRFPDLVVQATAK